MNTLHRKEGTITVFFCLFALLIVGGISYSLAIGNLINDKIEITNAADAQAQTMAAHAALGLNMISANNLAIGASMHIAAAAPLLSRHLAMARAFLSSCGDLPDNVTAMAGEDSLYQAYFDALKPVSKVYLQAAAGLTTLNEKTAKFWLAAALPKGMEVLRFNVPGSVSLPLQLSTDVTTGTGVVDLLWYRYRGLKQTNAKNAMCHTISAGNKGTGSNNPLLWLSGPLKSFGLPEVSDMSEIDKNINTAQLEKDMNDAIARSAWSCEYIPGTRRRRDPEGCDKHQKLVSARADYNQYKGGGILNFGSCGLGLGGNFAEQVAAKLGESEDSIGFLYIDETEVSHKFTDSVTFATLAGTAARVNGADDKLCPEAWQQEIGGVKVCDQSLLWSYAIKADAKSDSDLVLASGGLEEVVKENGELATGWSRTRWAMSQARAQYLPHGPGDPGQTMTKLQLFWPGWQARLMPPTVMDRLFGFVFGG